MRVFGEKSARKLQEVDPDMRSLAEGILQVMDITVITGHRGEADQNEKVRLKLSKTPYPKSKHNSLPSQAIDLAPWPIPKNWGSPGADRLYNNEEMKAVAQFYFMQGVAAGIAEERGIEIRGGHDWDKDNIFDDQGFDDLLHIEKI